MVCLLQHEVLAITEKVVLRVEDLLTWITEAADWSWGLSAVYNQNTKLMPRPSLLSDNSAIDLSEVDQEKEGLGGYEYLYVLLIRRCDNELSRKTSLQTELNIDTEYMYKYTANILDISHSDINGAVQIEY